MTNCSQNIQDNINKLLERHQVGVSFFMCLWRCGIMWDCVELDTGILWKVWKNIDRKVEKEYNVTNYIVGYHDCAKL